VEASDTTDLEVESTDDVHVTICRLSGSEEVVKTSLSATVEQLKDTLKATNIVQGLFAFSLMTDDGTVLKDGTSKLSECGLTDGSRLMVVMGRTRDYTKITEFDQVLCGTNYPQGVLTNDRGELFVCYFGGEVKIFGSDYKLLREHKLPTRKPPTQMAFAPTGELLISFTQERIGIFDPATMTLLRWFGDARDSNGIAVSGDLVFVSDSRRDVVCVYSLSKGDLLHTWTGFNHPCGLAVVDDQLLAVADRRNHRVRLFNFDGSIVTDIGSDSRCLRSPNDVAVDPDGNILVIDTGNERIAVFDKDGSPLASIMPGFFKSRGNTYSYLSVNQVTGAISVSFDDEHKVVVLAPLFPSIRDWDSSKLFRLSDS